MVYTILQLFDNVQNTVYKDLYRTNLLHDKQTFLKLMNKTAIRKNNQQYFVNNNYKKLKKLVSNSTRDQTNMVIIYKVTDKHKVTRNNKLSEKKQRKSYEYM